MRQSNLERELLGQIRLIGLPEPVAEFRFAPPRRWRFDLCWPQYRIAVEIEGGIWTAGRHVRPRGFSGDCEKHSVAAAQGWRLLRFTGAQIKSGAALILIEKMLKGELSQSK